jgi:hypothetical protein
MSVLVTNNANFHPPETWAVATAQQLFDVGAEVASSLRIPALQWQGKLAEYLVQHHTQVQADEQAQLDEDAAERYAAPHDVDRYLDDVVAGILTLAEGTPWQKMFEAPGIADQIRGVLGTHFATAQHIHRQAHARANLHIPEAPAFLKSIHGGEI